MVRLRNFEISLKSFCVELVVDSFDSKYLQFYSLRWNEISEESRPNFGPLGNQAPSTLIFIIEEFIRKEKLSYMHLRVLLPNETKRLTCNEDVEFSPFDWRTVALISKRCPNFEMLHYHTDLGIKDTLLEVYNILEKSIHQLQYLREINFHDFGISDNIIRTITLTCPHLMELNLHGTDLSDEALSYLHDDESVVKDSLTKLIIDDTLVTAKSVAQCILKLNKLTYFLSDEMIQAFLKIYEEYVCSGKKSEIFPSFEYTVFRGSLFVENKRLLNEEFLDWFTQLFPKVNHAIFVAIFQSFAPIMTTIVTSWINITHLELSSCSWYGEYFDQLKDVFDCCKENLISLKLESIVSVNITYLSKVLKRLEKLSLINNSYILTSEIEPFENLREVEIILISVSFETNFMKEVLFTMHLSSESLISLLASKHLERLFIYGQTELTNEIIVDLLARDSLRNLKELTLFSCPIGLNGIFKLFEKDNITIKKIVIGFCPYIRVSEINYLSVFIKQNGLTTNISSAMEIPYHLKSILHNMEY